MKAVREQHCLPPLTVTHTRARARNASKYDVWLEVLRKPSFAARAVYELYTTHTHTK
jgi:hypothetical protein